MAPVDDADFVMPLSVFENKDDNRPARHEMAWHAFAQRLARYDERDDKDGKAWSPVTYRPGTTRGKANVEQVFALVLDIDHGPLPLDLLDGREYVAHTTFQHTPEAPRWRVVLPLERPIDGKDWPGFWLRANAYFGGCVDPATKDSSRIFYLPSCPPGAAHEVHQRHGLLLDPNQLPEIPEYTPAVRRQGVPSLLARYLAEWAFRFTKAKVDDLARMPRDSGRNTACNRVAYLLGGLITEPAHGLEIDEVGQLLLEACARNGLLEDDGQRSIEATIRSGLEAGLLKPWSPSDQDPPPSNVRSFTDHKRHTGAAAQGMRLEYERMIDTRSEPISWLWRNRLARGKATLLMGDPGLGKSLISHWLAAQVSIGAAWPDEGECEHGAAILFTIEDGLADTVKPRLEAAGADCNKIIAVRGVVDLETSMDERMFALEEHVSLLEKLIADEKATLVVLDPVTAYLGANVNAHKDTDVRRVLAPLQMMAERTGVALLLLMHLTKGSGVSALYRATGSIAFPAVCRVVLGVAPDPNDSTGKRRLLLPIKFNIAPEAMGIGYRIETTKQKILPRADERDQPPILVWDDEPVLVDATSAMDRSGTVQERGALADCKRALLQIVVDQPVLSTEGMRQLKEAGASTSPSTVQRARDELGIESRKDGKGPWYWHPPKGIRYVSPRAGARDTLDGSTSLNDLNGQGTPKNSEDFKKNSAAWSPIQSQESKLPEDSSRARGPWWNAQDQAEELCPVHHKRFDLHDCDQL